MKKKLFLSLLMLLIFQVNTFAQIRHLIVEKYYISDSLDATDTIDGAARAIPIGSKTFRVYVELDSGYKIHKLYGAPGHPLIIASDSNFYNNIDRPTTACFGYMINKNWYGSNPILALDSWLTLAQAVKTHKGVLKNQDTDGSLIGGSNNYGGTAAIASGLMINADTSCGIPVDTADGMLPNTTAAGTFIDNGFRDITGVDTTIFGSVNIGSHYYSTSSYIQQNDGVTGALPVSYKVLIGQFTTKGNITFQLNLELIDSTGGVNNGNLFNFVANNNGLSTTGDTTVSPMLKYPPDIPVCGCMDPNYLEYNPNAPCSSADSCHTPIVFGCLDTLACNYDAHANYNIPSLCCYPGKCNDRDISLVCPGIASNSGFSIFPNPVVLLLTLQISTNDFQEIKYIIYDSYGTSVMQKDLGTQSGEVTQQVDVSNLQVGLYLVRMYVGGSSFSKTFMKD